MLRKNISFNIAFFLIFGCVGFGAYYFLLHSNIFSISSLLENAHDSTFETHILMVALLPIYIAGIIFGSGFFGLYVGSRLQHIFYKKKKNIQSS